MIEKVLRRATSSAGRLTRAVFGLALLTSGLFFVEGTIGVVMTFLALIPIAGAFFDLCLLARLLGYPLSGEETRFLLKGK